VLTPTTIVQDQPSNFAYAIRIYELRGITNEEYHGDRDRRYALAMSWLNNATVPLAEEVGYDKGADLASHGITSSVKATPAMALGAYDATPIGHDAAYTVLPTTDAVRISPTMI